MKMDCTSAIERLPWMVNGTLADEERSELEAHLAGCPICRSELAETIEVFRLASAHPPTAVLVEWAQGREDAGAELIERHVAGCPACAEEVDLVREAFRLEAFAPRGGAPALRAVVAWRRAALAAAAVAVVGLLALVTLWMPGGSLGSGARGTAPLANLPVVELLPDGFALRGGDEPPVIETGSDAVALILATRAEAVWDHYRLRVLDADGRELWWTADLIRQPTDDFTVLLPVKMMTGAEIRLVLDGGGDGTWTELETYRLRTLP